MYKFCTLAIIALSGLFTLTACGGAAAPTAPTVAPPQTLTIESICADNPFDLVCVSSTYNDARALVVDHCTVNPAGCSAEVITCISNPFDEKCVFVAYGEAYESVRSSLVSTCATGSGASCNTVLLTSVEGDNTPSIAACIADPFIAQCIQSNNFAAYRAPHIADCEANFNPATCTLAQAAVCAIGTVAYVNPFSALCTKEDNEYDDIRLRHADACRNGTNGNAICTGVTACNTRPFATDCIANTAFVSARRDLIAKCIIGDAVLTNPDCTNAVADGETLTCLTNPYGDDCLAANQLGAAEVQSGGQNDGQSIVTTARMERLAYCGDADANAALCGAEVLVDLCTVEQNPFSPLCVDPQGVTVVATAREAFVDKCRTDNPTPANCTGDIIACINEPFGDDCTNSAYDNTRVAFAPSCNVAEATRPSGCTANVIACNADPYNADAFDGAGCTRMFFPIPKNLTAFCLADAAWSTGCDTLATNTPSVRARRAELAGNCRTIDSAPHCGNAINGQTVFSCNQNPYQTDCTGNTAFDDAKVAFCIADTAWDENCDNQAVADSQVLMERTRLAMACVALDTKPYCSRSVGDRERNVFTCNRSPFDIDCVDNIAFATIGAEFCTQTNPWHQDCDTQATAGSDVRARREELAQGCVDADLPPCSDRIGISNTVFSCTETPFEFDCVGNIAFNAAKVAYCTADATAWHANCDESGADAALDYAAILAERKLQIETCVNADAFPCNRALGSGQTVFFCKTNPFMGVCRINAAFGDIRATICVRKTAWGTGCNNEAIDTQSVRDHRGDLAELCLDTTTFDYCAISIGSETVFSCGQDPFLTDCTANEAFNSARVEFCTAEATAWDEKCDTAAMIDMGDLAVIRASRQLHASKCTGDNIGTGHVQPAFCTTQRFDGGQTVQTCVANPFNAQCAGVVGFDVAKTKYCQADAAWDDECNGADYINDPDVIAKRIELVAAAACSDASAPPCSNAVGANGQTVFSCTVTPLHPDCVATFAFDVFGDVFCTVTKPWHEDCDELGQTNQAVIAKREELAGMCRVLGIFDYCDYPVGEAGLTVHTCLRNPLNDDCAMNPAFANLREVFCTETIPWHLDCDVFANPDTVEGRAVITARAELTKECINGGGKTNACSRGLADTTGDGFRDITVRVCRAIPLHPDCVDNPAFADLVAVFCTETNPWHEHCNQQVMDNPVVLAERKRQAVLCENSNGYCGLPVSVGSRFSVFYCKGDPLHDDCAANDAFDELGAVFCTETRPWHGRCDDAANPDTGAGLAIIAKRAELALPCIDGGGQVQVCSRRQGSLLVRDCRVRPFDPNCTNPAFNDIKIAYCAAETTFWDAGCDTTDMITEARIQVVNDCNVVGTKPVYCGVNVNSATGPMLGDCITNPFTAGCVDNTAFDGVKLTYCGEGTRAWDEDCDGLAQTRPDILHKRRTLVAACTGNNQPAYCTTRTFSEARYRTTTTTYIVDKGRIRTSRVNNLYWVSATPESDYGEGTVVGTETTITDESGTTDRQIITATTIRFDSGGSYHESNVAIEITVVTSVLSPAHYATKTLADCLANPFQLICTHRLGESSVGPPVAGATAVFDVYCGKGENAWKEDCSFNRYSDARRNNDCIANGEISRTNAEGMKTIIVADNALFSDFCNTADAVSEEIVQSNEANRKKAEGENDAIIKQNAEIDSANAARNMRNTGRAARNREKTRTHAAAMLVYEEIIGQNALIMERNQGRTTRNALLTEGQTPEVLEEPLAAVAPVLETLETLEPLVARIALKQPAYTTPHISVESERQRRVNRCDVDSGTDDCNFIIYEAITARQCADTPDLSGCTDLETEKQRSVDTCTNAANRDIEAACNETARDAVTVGTCVASPFINDCLGERTQTGKNAALCRADSDAPECNLPVSGDITIATCIKSPHLAACRDIPTFFTAFAGIATKQQTVCVGQGYFENDFCSKNPQLLTNAITVCRGKGADEAELPGCENIRTQITACENAPDPFNPLGVADAQGVSCNDVAFDNLLTNHRNNCETNFVDGIRNATCKSIYDLTCVAGGTGRWVNLNSPLCLGVDDVKSYYREIAFCDLPTTSVHHPACRTVPRNWQTWFDSATTDSSDPNDAIGSVVNGWATGVGDVLAPTLSGFLALPVGSNTIDFTTGRFHLPDTRTHTLTLDSTHVNLANGGDRSDNDILANSGFESRGSGSIRHFQGDALDGIIFGRAYKVDQSASESQNRRFYAAILPTTDLGGPVQTSGNATWNGAVSYIRDDGDIIGVAGRGANRNTVNRAVSLTVNFSNRTIDGTFRIDHNNVTSDSEFMLLRMSFNPAGIIRGEVELGRQPISHPNTGRPVFPDGFRHDTGASKLTGIIGSEGAVGVFYTDGVVSQNKRVNHLVGGFVTCPHKSVIENGVPRQRCRTNGQ